MVLRLACRRVLHRLLEGFACRTIVIYWNTCGPKRSTRRPDMPACPWSASFRRFLARPANTDGNELVR